MGIIGAFGMNGRSNGSVEGIRRRLEDGIANGEYPVGGTLPSDRALAEALDVDRRTVARAIDLMESAGRIRVEGRSKVVLAATPEAPHLGLCLDDSVTERDADNAIGTGRLLIGRGLMMRLSEVAPRRTMVWCNGLNEDPLDNVPTLQTLQNRGIGGVAIWPTLPASDGTLVALRTLRDRLPLVLLDRRVPGFESDFIGFDDEEGDVRSPATRFPSAIDGLPSTAGRCRRQSTAAFAASRRS